MAWPGCGTSSSGCVPSWTRYKCRLPWPSPVAARTGRRAGPGWTLADPGDHPHLRGMYPAIPDRVWGWWRLSLSSALRGGDVAATSPRLNTCCRKVELNSLISVFSKVSANRDVNRVTASGCSPVLFPPLYRAGGFDPPPALYSAIEARSSVSGFFLPHLPQGRCDSCVSNRQVQRSCSLKLWIQSGLTVCWKTASKSS